MKSLKRTRVSSFLEEGAHTLSEIEELCAAGRLKEILMPVDRLFLRYPALYMREGKDASLYNGNKLRKEEVRMEEEPLSGDSCFRVYDSGGCFYALYRYEPAQGCYRNVKMFVPGAKRM